MTALGFVLLARVDRVELFRLAPSGDRPDRRLSVWRTEDSVFAAIGRLHYRAGPLTWLRGRVPDAVYETCLNSDAALALHLYQAGGLERLTHLEGDFSVAGFQGKPGRLIALRDPLGACPLFWSRSARGIAISDSIRPLLDHGVLADVDEEYVADYLAATGTAAELPGQRTAYRNVQRVPPGWALQARPDMGTASCRPYWDWKVRIVPVPARSIDEAGGLVRQQLEASIGERLSPAGRTASHLSGGMDSTGVALLAAALSGGHGAPLDALTLVFDGDPVLAQEREYYESAVTGQAGLRHHLIPADDFLEWDDYESLPPLDEPAPMAVDVRSTTELVETARRAGADTILAGDGADHLFAMPAAARVAELFRSGRVGEGLRLSRQVAVADADHAWSIVRAALGLLLPLRVPAGLGTGFGSAPVSFEAMTHVHPPPWLSQEYVRRYRLAARTVDHLTPKACGRRFSVRDIGDLVGDWYNWNLAIPRGVLQTRPFVDPRLITLVLGLPAKVSVPVGSTKPVLAAALSAVLPEKILRRRRKAHFNSRLRGYARHRHWLERRIREAPLDADMIDRTVLIECVDKAALGLFRDTRVVGRLRMTLTLLMWFSDRNAWRAAPVRYLPAIMPEPAATA